VCVGCQANNFASRNSCFKCNEPRADVGGGDGYGGGGYGGAFYLRTHFYECGYVLYEAASLDTCVQ